MTKGKVNLREKLRSYKFENGVLQRIPCTRQENEEYEKILKDGGTLPEGVYAWDYSNGATSTTEFYVISETDLTESELKEYLAYKQLSLITTIKNCVLFFTVLTIISILYFLYLMSAW